MGLLCGMSELVDGSIPRRAPSVIVGVFTPRAPGRRPRVWYGRRYDATVRLMRKSRKPPPDVEV